MSEPHNHVSAGSEHPQISFLREAANYFRNRPTHGEDSAFWSNVANADNCEKAANLIERMLDAAQPAVDSLLHLAEQLRKSAHNDADAGMCRVVMNGVASTLQMLASQPSPAATVEPNTETPEQWAERWRAAKAHARLSAATGYDEPQGYAASLRQMAKWVREAVDPRTADSQRITLDDIDAEELDAAAAFIARITDEPQPTQEPPFLAALQHTLNVMKLAHKRGGDRLMSIWTADIKAIEQAIAAGSLSRPHGK